MPGAELESNTQALLTAELAVWMSPPLTTSLSKTSLTQEDSQCLGDWKYSELPVYDCHGFLEDAHSRE